MPEKIPSAGGSEPAGTSSASFGLKVACGTVRVSEYSRTSAPESTSITATSSDDDPATSSFTALPGLTPDRLQGRNRGSSIHNVYSPSASPAQVVPTNPPVLVGSMRPPVPGPGEVNRVGSDAPQGRALEVRRDRRARVRTVVDELDDLVLARLQYDLPVLAADHVGRQHDSQSTRGELVGAILPGPVRSARAQLPDRSDSVGGYRRSTVQEWLMGRPAVSTIRTVSELGPERGPGTDSTGTR